jgi:hypothetical protein
MKRALCDFVFPAIRFCLLRLAWLLAPLAAAAAPAAAQSPCPATGWEHHKSGYEFDYYSGRKPDRTGLVYCVHNLGRGMFFDWQGSGLSSAIPPGQTIYTTAPASRLALKTRLFFYGARRSFIVVPTAFRTASFGPAAAPWAARSGPGPFRRAFALPAEAAVESGESGALLYVPTDLSFLVDFARHPMSLRKLIERLEASSDQLRPFGMTFANQVTAAPDGRLTVAWRCRYALPNLGRAGLLYLRFSDPDLHRRMFKDDKPFAIAAWNAEFEASLPPLDPGRLAARSTKLQILLPDRKTVIASIPISWSGPRG